MDLFSINACLLLVFGAPCISALSTGPPGSTCIGILPHHGVSPRLELGKFSIKANATYYKPNDVISVEVSSFQGYSFSGVQIMAMRVGSNGEEQLGVFDNLTPPTKLRFMNCSGQFYNMVSHKNSESVKGVSATWSIPYNAGPIYFVTTVVVQFTEFYYDIRSDIIQPVEDSPIVPPEYPLSPVGPMVDPINWDECGDSKGCLLYPTYCTGDNCKAAVSFRVNEDADPKTVTFEAMAKVEGYLSIGLSDDMKMGYDHTMSCTAYYDRVTVQNGFNHPLKWNVRLRGTNLTNQETSYRDGKIMCRFTRPISMAIEMEEYGPKTFDLNNKFHIFIGWGHLYKLSDVMGKHDELPVISANKVDFSDKSIYTGSVMNPLIRAHASLMAVAWLGFAGLAIVMARHYKDGFNDKKICGIKVWFHIHRAAAILTFILTVAGLVLILIHADGKIIERESAHTHLCLGFTVIALVCAQLLGGLLRPAPDAAIRPYFNVLHRLFGTAALVLSAATVIYAYRIDIFSYEARRFGERAVAVWAGVFVILEFLMMTYAYLVAKTSAQKTRSDEYNLDKVGRVGYEETAPSSNFLLALFVIFTAASITTALCMTLFF